MNQRHTSSASRPKPIFFKYRSLENWRFVVDLFVNQRLFAAPYRDLNDPMEGRYSYFKDEISREFRRQVRGRKGELRICSLSEDPKNTLMWSYYAGGHKGIAVGVVPKHRRQDSPRQEPVIYEKEITLKSEDVDQGANAVAIHVLSRKLDAWAHEKEIRIFTRGEFVRVDIRKVLFGCLMEKQDKELVRALVRRTNPGVRIEEVRRSDLDMPLR